MPPNAATPANRGSGNGRQVYDPGGIGADATAATDRMQADIEAGLTSCLRVISAADDPDGNLDVLRHQAAEAIRIAAKAGIAKHDVVDRLYSAAVGRGMEQVHGVDAVERALAEGVAKAEADIEARETPRRSRFTPIAIDDVAIGADPPWVIDRLMPARGLAVTYGPPKSRKSFLIADAMFAVARGAPWAGRMTMQGPVFYCTGEGVRGFKGRLIAMRRHYGVEGQGVPFYMIEDVPDLGSERTNLAELIAAIDHIASSRGSPRAIVLDTVARCMGDGDENSARDMGRFIARCGELERRYECVVVPIHHSGKDPGRGGRGSNALSAAADTTWEVEKFDDTSQATIREMKDGAEGESWTFRLRSIPDFDRKSETSAGSPETSFETSVCVVEILSEPCRETETETRVKPPVGVRGDLFNIIRLAIAEAGERNVDSPAVPKGTAAISRDMLKSYCRTKAWQDPDTKPDSFRAMLSGNLSGLRSAGLIDFDRSWVWLK